MEKKLKSLEECICHVAEVTHIPYGIVRIEMTDEANVSNLIDFTEEDVDKMISLYEKYYSEGLI